MCSAPDVPEAVQRQDARMPERSARGNGAEDPLRRRQGYSALLRAAAGAGASSPATTTGNVGGGATKLGV
jgi:hypothetical protein